MATIKGTDGSKSEISFVLLLISLQLRVCKDVEETEAAFLEYIGITLPLDEIDRTLGGLSVKWSFSMKRGTLSPRISQEKVLWTSER